MTTLAPPRPTSTTIPTPPTAPSTPPIRRWSRQPAPQTLRWDWTLTAEAIRDWVYRQPKRSVIGTCRSARRCMVAAAITELFALEPGESPLSGIGNTTGYAAVTYRVEIYRNLKPGGDIPREQVLTIPIAAGLDEAICRYDRLDFTPTRERVLRCVFGMPPRQAYG